MPRQTRRYVPSFPYWPALLLGLLALTGLYAVSRYKFLLFHSLAEVYSIVIAIAVFVIFWNTRHFLHNDFYLIVGFGALFGGLFGIIYVFAYPGMHVLPISDGNLALQAKTVAQSYVAFSCVAAFAFLRRKVNQHLFLLTYALIAAIAIVAIYPWRIFPDCYIAGAGVTSFAKGAVAVNSVGYLASLGLLIANRGEFGHHVFRLLLVPSIAFFVQDAFSASAMDINGFARTVAHLCQVVSLYFVYRVFVVVGLRNPYDLLFIERKRAEVELKKLNEHLEQRVTERAEALAESEQRLALATSGARVGIFDWNAVTGESQWTPELETIFGYAPTTTTATTISAWPQGHLTVPWGGLAIKAAADVERLALHGGQLHEIEDSVRRLERECRDLKAALTEYKTTAGTSPRGRE
jgi:PAS domain-containing protein